MIVEAPVSNTRKPGASIASFGVRRARLRLLRQNLFKLAVIDHGHRVAARSLLSAVDARRQVGAVLRLIGGLRHLRLAWEVAGESILPAGEFDPFSGSALRDGERRTGKGQGECRHDEWSETHGTFLTLKVRPEPTTTYTTASVNA